MGEKQREWRKKNEYKTKFSVIIPMRDSEEYIENALNSIKQQKYENCIFEDATARLQLYGKANKIKIAGINTHKYFVRPGKSICTTQTFNHLKASVEMARRISKLVKEGKVDKKYQKYIITRLMTMPGTLAWVLFCMGQYKIYQHKTKHKQNNTLEK